MKANYVALRRWPTPRDNKPWTAHDLARMKAHARAKWSARQSAASLGRSLGAVKFKAMTEGVRFHAIEQPRGAQSSRSQRARLSAIATRRHARARRNRRRAAA